MSALSDLNLIVASRVRLRLNFDATVRVEPCDFSRALGVAVIIGDRRHAVEVKINNADITGAADFAALALNEWWAAEGSGA